MNNTYTLGFMAACNAAGLDKQAADMLYKQALGGKAGKIAFQRLMANVAKAGKNASKAKGVASKALPSAMHYPVVPVSGSRALVPVSGSRALVPSTAERAIVPSARRGSGALSIENGGVEVLPPSSPSRLKVRGGLKNVDVVDADYTMAGEKALPEKIRKLPKRTSRRPAPAPAQAPAPAPAPATAPGMDTPIPTQAAPQLGSFREWAQNNPWGLALGSGAAGYMLGRHNNR